MPSKSNPKKFTANASSADLTAFASVPQVGRKTIKKILKYLTKYEVTFSYFWQKMPAKLTNKLLTKTQIDSIRKFKKEYTISSYNQSLKEQGIISVAFTDDLYPPLLLETTDFPVVLFAKGKVELLGDRRMIAVVGTRKITSYGRLATQKIVSELCNYSAVINSGFMYGVDAAAHRAAIQNRGKTVGVLGYGFDYLFPKNQQKLFNRVIKNNGLFISEFTPDTPPKAGHFPVRNRIIAGMSQAVVVVEAAKRSGTSITANCALEEGRLVCAVPGPITSKFSEGTKRWLQQGALMISSGEDIINQLRRSYPESWQLSFANPGEKRGKKRKQINTAEQKIYDMLLAQPLSTEKLSQQLSLPIDKLNSLLTQLELNGRIVRDGLHWTAAVEEN